MSWVFLIRNSNFFLVIYVITIVLYLATFAAYLVLWVLWGYLSKCVLNVMIVYINVCITAFLLILSLLHPRSESDFPSSLCVILVIVIIIFLYLNFWLNSRMPMIGRFLFLSSCDGAHLSSRIVGTVPKVHDKLPCWRWSFSLLF